MYFISGSSVRNNYDPCLCINAQKDRRYSAESWEPPSTAYRNMRCLFVRYRRLRSARATFR